VRTGVGGVSRSTAAASAVGSGGASSVAAVTGAYWLLEVLLRNRVISTGKIQSLDGRGVKPIMSASAGRVGRVLFDLGLVAKPTAHVLSQPARRKMVNPAPRLMGR
jgi:hypothetical protein